MTAAALLLGAVTAERIAELCLAHRNTATLIAKGALEFAPGHYPAIVLMHALWLAGLWIFGATHLTSPIWLAIFLSLQVLRVWILMTLGPRWTTRIIILPGAPLVSNGPYRIFSHPNYLVVVGEIVTLPLCLGLPWLALVFSGANAIILLIRVRAENAALIGARHVERARARERASVANRGDQRCRPHRPNAFNPETLADLAVAILLHHCVPPRCCGRKADAMRDRLP